MRHRIVIEFDSDATADEVASLAFDAEVQVLEPREDLPETENVSMTWGHDWRGEAA